MSVESDTFVAVSAQWAARFLDVYVPGGLHLDELQRPDATLPALPYAVFAVVLGRPPGRWTVGSPGVSLTRPTVTITVHGTGVLGPAVSALHAAFDWSVNGGTPGGNKLPYPAGNSHEYTELGTEEEGVTPLERSGQKVRRASVRWVLWVRRTQG